MDTLYKHSLNASAALVVGSILWTGAWALTYRKVWYGR